MSYVATRDGRRQRSAGTRAPSVPRQLDELHGHSVGTIELPHHMATGRRSRRQFDLADPAQQRQAYQAVLCQAADCCEINDLLNPSVLRRVWRSLHLPGRIRDAWESRHPDLAHPRMRAPADDLTAGQMIAARISSVR